MERIFQAIFMSKIFTNKKLISVVKKDGVSVGATVIGVIILMYVIAPIMLLVSYTIIQGDDPTFVLDIANRYGDGSIAGLNIINICRECYFQYNNYFSFYSGVFFMSLFNPFYYGGFSAISIIMPLLFLFFSLSLICILWCIIGIQIKENGIRLFFISLFVYCIIGVKVYGVYTWFGGFVPYLFPLSCGLFAISIMWCGYVIGAKQSRLMVFVATILALISAGGILAVSIGVMYCLMILSAYKYITRRTIQVGDVIVLLNSMLGTLINICGPGNYIRHSQTVGSEINVLGALRYTIVLAYNQLQWLGENKIYGIFLLIAFSVGLLIKDKDTTNLAAAIKMSCLLVLLPLFCIFPVILGYSAQLVPELPDRVKCVVDVFTLLTATNLMINLGRLVQKRVEVNEQTVFSLTSLLFLMLWCINIFSFKSDISLLKKELKSGTLKAYNYEIGHQLEKLGQYNGDEVILEDWPDINSHFLVDMELSDKDINNEYNMRIAQCYGKRAVLVKYVEYLE